jgi:hypothetical protein
MADVNTAPYPTPAGPPAYYDNPPPSSPPPPMTHSQSQQQQQQSSSPTEPELVAQQPFQYQKSHTNIQPLIDNSSSMGESPTVGFSSADTANASHANDYSFDEPSTSYSNLSSTTRGFNLRYQLFLDKISPHWKARWTFSIIALLVFMARVIISQGWYVICYGLAIYYLNLLIGFISPRVDPSLNMGDEDDDAGPMLPTSANDEFKPFIRRVPEFKFWISGTKATLIALAMTMFSIFDVPVFWPILLIYFIILFACTMRQQIKHMIRYSYVPWDSGKKKYASSGNDNSSATVI